MFTGIVEETGTIERITPGKAAIELEISVGVCGSGLKPGDSLAVNGCCLTVVDLKGRGRHRRVRMDLLRETWERTNLQFASVGAPVNLERSLRADSRLGGHFVTGHIDGMGKIAKWERSGQDHLLEIKAPAAVMRYIVMKGSIAIDGISLTVASVKQRSFGVWIIPHTHEVTNLQARSVGDSVNLEADMLGKYVERFASAFAGRSGGAAGSRKK